MSQQTETNSVHCADVTNDRVSDSITQIPFSSHYFRSMQGLVFLLCETCFGVHLLQMDIS
jgi:hypothetical protein